MSVKLHPSMPLRFRRETLLDGALKLEKHLVHFRMASELPCPQRLLAKIVVGLSHGAPSARCYLPSVRQCRADAAPIASELHAAPQGMSADRRPRAELPPCDRRSVPPFNLPPRMP